MNLESLKSGISVKNYKTLCNLLDEPVKSGKSKQLQLNEWLRHFEYEKKGNSYIIKCIYNDPIKKEDKRGGNNNELLEINDNTMTHILLGYAMSNNGVYYFSKSRLFYLLGFINNDYNYGKDNPQEVTKDLNVTYTAYNYFYQNTYAKYKTSLERLLKYMSNQKKIIYNEVVMLYKGSEHMPATDEQIKELLKIERKVLKELEFEKIQDVFICRKANEYYDKINYYLMDHDNLNADGYYKSYKIIVVDEYQKEIKDHANRLIENGLTFNELRENMNKKLLNKNVKMFENKTEKTILSNDGWGELDPFKPWLTHVTDEKFANDGKILFNQFCKLYNEKYTNK